MNKSILFSVYREDKTELENEMATKFIDGYLVDLKYPKKHLFSGDKTYFLLTDDKGFLDHDIMVATIRNISAKYYQDNVFTIDLKGNVRAISGNGEVMIGKFIPTKEANVWSTDCLYDSNTELYWNLVK